jgi:ribosomal-protein-alanine N-acetyltransferase
MFPERIETDRLELAALTPANVDVLDYYDICSGNRGDIETITQFLPWEPHDTPKEFLDRLASQREAGQNAEFAVFPKENETEEADEKETDETDDPLDEFAGAVGLCPDWDRRTGELGIWLRKPFWGQGYYDEAFAALTRVAFERLDLEVVEVVHQHGNDKSRRATEKFVRGLGGTHEGRLRNYWVGPGGPADAHRYTVTKAEYEASSDRDEEVNV